MRREPANHFFSMIGTREVLSTDAVHFEQMVEAIEQAIVEDPGLVFDLAKSLIETACKTILKDRGYVHDNMWDLPRLLRETTGNLQFIPDDIDRTVDIDASLKKTLGGLQIAIHGICELRQAHGVASHGKDAYFKQLDDFHARFIARSADVVISFLFRVHRKYPVDVSIRRLIYSGMSDYNNWIDEQNDAVMIFDLEYKPSEVLFNIDRVAYRDLLSDCETDELPEENPTENNVQGSNVNE